MWKFLKRLFGYKEVLVVDKTLRVYRADRKYYGIVWRSVFKNFVTLLKSWPRPGKYEKYYYSLSRAIKPIELGHIRPEQIKIALDDVRFTASFKKLGTLDKPRAEK